MYICTSTKGTIMVCCKQREGHGENVAVAFAEKLLILHVCLKFKSLHETYHFMVQPMRNNSINLLLDTLVLGQQHRLTRKRKTQTGNTK